MLFLFRGSHFWHGYYFHILYTFQCDIEIFRIWMSNFRKETTYLQLPPRNKTSAAVLMQTIRSHQSCTKHLGATHCTVELTTSPLHPRICYCIPELATGMTYVTNDSFLWNYNINYDIWRSFFYIWKLFYIFFW